MDVRVRSVARDLKDPVALEHSNDIEENDNGEGGIEYGSYKVFMYIKLDNFFFVFILIFLQAAQVRLIIKTSFSFSYFK